MTYLNNAKMLVSARYVKAYYRLPRRESLDAEMTNIITHYFTHLAAGSPFEARGLIVTGESRSGKSREITAAVEQFNSEGLILPSGQPARYVQCILSGMISWKDLGIKVLEALEYPMNAQRTQGYIWGKVVEQARLGGVIGIHFDECQHMFSETGTSTNQKVLDGFKTLMKDTRWPFSIILSGVPDLAKYVTPYFQLRQLLYPVHFDLINVRSDIEELNSLAFAFADRVHIDFAPVATKDFYERLAFAGVHRWGLVIELIVEALTLCKMDDKKAISLPYFEKAFAKQSKFAAGYSPFSADDYRDAFDEDKLQEHLLRPDQ